MRQLRRVQNGSRVSVRVSGRILAGLLSAFPLGVGASVDYNDELRTSYRADVIGPEVWTSDARNAGLMQGRSAAYVDSELPAKMHVEPQPGLSGKLHVVHGTGLEDVLVPEIQCEGRPLRLTAVGNVWTPAQCRTRYRADSLGLDGEPAELGDSVYLERKCVTTDNVFVAEGVLRNAGARARRYRIGFRTHPQLPRRPGVFAFETVAMCRKTPRTVCTAVSLPEKDVTLVRNAEVRFRYALAFSPKSPDVALSLVGKTVDAADPFKANVRAYNEWMRRQAPELRTDDATMRKLHAYRWFVLKRAVHDARRLIPDHVYPRPAVYESPVGDWFGCVIGLPVPMHVQEMGWMRDPSLGRGNIRNWCEKVPGYDGYIQFTGMSVWRFLEHHPDVDFAREICSSVAHDAERRAGNDPNRLPVQVGSWTTGAEYQPNFYQFTEPKWDFRHDSEFAGKFGLSPAKLIRLDTAGFAIASLIGAARVAHLAGDAETERRFAVRSEKMLEWVRRRHWDDELGLFLSANPTDGRLAAGSACYDSFVPYMFGMVGERSYFRAFDKLCSRDWFWDEFAVTTVSKNCPMYCGGNFLRNPVEGVADEARPHHYGCCWNGPVWHYADSLIAEAFGQVSERDPSRRGKWVEFFRNWTESHFPYGDRSMPRAAEHFRPEDGARLGTAFDYFHSSWLDPFYRYWCGVSVSDDLKTVTFSPFAGEDFELCNVPLAGREFGFSQRNGELAIRDASGRILASGRNCIRHRLASSEVAPCKAE